MKIEGLPDVTNYMDQVAPLLGKVQLPVTPQGEVPNQALAQMLSQVIVTQRFMQIEADLQVVRLSAMFGFLAINPLPQVLSEPEIQEWAKDLCKYLHNALTEHVTQVIDMIKKQATQQKPQLVVPQQSGPRIIVPK